MDNREIARALGRTDGATKVLLHRAIRQLEEIVRRPRDADGELSMSERAPDFEALLRAGARAGRPARATSGAPGDRRSARWSSWPPTSSRRGSWARCSDPRNWPRAALGPAAAVVVGTGAAVGLVVLRTQRRRHKRARASRTASLDLAERTLRDAAREARQGASTKCAPLIRVIRSGRA